MIFHENRLLADDSHENHLLADDSHEISYLIFFRKIGKDISKFVVCYSCDRRFKG